MPLVEVSFRALKKNVPTTNHVVSVPLSSLPHYRIGTIWRKGQCVSDTVLDTRKFKVDFSPDGWHLTSRSELVKQEIGHVFSDLEYPLNYGTQDSMKLISFRLPKGKNLLVSCVDYFVRAYARNMDVCRALTTLLWSDVMTVLYEEPKRSAHQWLVRPARNMRKHDAVYLGHLLYDDYTEMRSYRVNSQFTSRSPQHKVILEAEPWFTGPGTLICRGKWINDGKTFLCLDLMGSSQPDGQDIEWKPTSFDSSEGLDGAGRTVMPRSVRFAHPDEFLQELSNVEPDKHSQITIVKTPPFQVVGKKRTVVVSKQILPADKGKLGPQPPDPDLHAGGSGIGSGKSVGKLEHEAETRLESQGFLRDIWNAFKSLKDHKPNNITQLDWYTITDGFQSSEPPKAILLTPIASKDVASKVRSWVYVDRSINQLRGLLVLRIEIAGADYFCFETQRKEVEGGSSSGRAGLLMRSHVADEEGLANFVEEVSSSIRYKMGVFKNMKTIFPPTSVTFNHTQQDEKIMYRNRLIGAFRDLGVHVE